MLARKLLYVHPRSSANEYAAGSDAKLDRKQSR